MWLAGRMPEEFASRWVPTRYLPCSVENTHELRWLVRAGMTPIEVLASATINGAMLVGREGELGAIAPGYIADLVAVEGDPLAIL